MNKIKMDKLIKELRETFKFLGFIEIATSDKTTELVSIVKPVEEKPLLLVTEDGEYIYKEDPCFVVVYNNVEDYLHIPLWEYTHINSISHVDHESFKYFAKEENLLQYIKEQQPKKYDAIKIIGVEQYNFLVGCTIDYSQGECILGNYIVLYKNDNDSLDWYDDTREGCLKNGNNIISFGDYIQRENLKVSWLEYISNIAISKGFKNDVEYKWKNLNTKIVKYPLTLTIGGFLCDYENNMIYNIDCLWPDIVVKEEPVIIKEDKLLNFNLIKGEIYTSFAADNSRWKVIYRVFEEKESTDKILYVYYFSSKVKSSRVKSSIEFNNWLVARSLTRFTREATNEEKKKLIKAEVKNNYFYELINK